MTRSITRYLAISLLLGGFTLAALPAGEALARAGGGTSVSEPQQGTSTRGDAPGGAVGGGSSDRAGGSTGGWQQSAPRGPLGELADLLSVLLFIGIFAGFALIFMRASAQSSGGAGASASGAGGEPGTVPGPPPAPRPADDAELHARMDRMNAAFAAGLAGRDAAWDPAQLKARVAEVFQRVQHAWTERNQELARDCMSQTLYERHKRQTDHMLALGKRNVLRDVQLLGCDMAYLADRAGAADDEVWVVVRGQMIDYEEIVDWPRYAKACGATTPEAEAALREQVAGEYGPRETPSRFTELWKLVREPHAWVLDKIEHDLSLVADAPRPYSEEADAPPVATPWTRPQPATPTASG